MACTCRGGYSPNLIVSNGLKSILCVHVMWRSVRSKPDCVKLLEINSVSVKEGTVQTWLFQMVGNQSSVCMASGGGYSSNLCQMAGNQSYVCTACGGEGMVQTCVKWLDINPMCVHSMCRRVWSKPDCFKWLEINPLCVHCIWRRVQFKPDSVKWLEIKPMYVHGMWRRAKAKPNCVKWLEVKPMCVHCKWRRVQSKPDCVKWLEIKPICADSMLHVLCKYCCYCCDMKPVTWPLLFFNRKKCYLSIDMFIYSTFAELNLLFIHTFYSVKHLKNIYIAHFYLACWQQ